MEKLLKHLDEQKIQYRYTGDNVIEIIDFGFCYFVDMESKQSVFRSVDFNGEQSTYINMFETKEELLAENINYVIIYFGEEWNYIDLTKDEIEFVVLANVGKVQKQSVDYDYINLGIHTEMELLNGSGNVKDWVKRAKFLGHSHIGMCDKNTLGALLNFQKACDEAEINPVFGYTTDLDIGMDDEGVTLKLYVHNNVGLQNLLRIQKRVAVDLEYGFIDLNYLLQYSEGLSIVIGKLHAEWAYKNPKTIKVLREHFREVYFQFDLNEYKADRIDREVLKSAKFYFHNMYGKENHIKLILLSDCYYVNKFEFNNKIMLNKISIGAAHNQSSEQWYKTIDEHIETITPLFDVNWGVGDIIRESANNSVELAESCNARFCMDKNYMPRYEMTKEELSKYSDPVHMFDELLEEGFKRKVPKGQEDIYRKRLEMEKYIIKSTDNVNYMLNQYDVTNWAKRNDIMYGAGRGSAAGSLVLYLLNVTEVDPIRFNLLFERFLLPERAGLYEATVTKLVDKVTDSSEVVEVELENGKVILFDIDSQIAVDAQERAMYADELKEGDAILLDNINKVIDL